MRKTRLFEIADERGIRYKWIAAQLGYTPEYLSRIKHGDEPVTAEFERRACGLFADVPAEFLFFDAAGSHENHSVLTVSSKVEVPA